MADTFTRTPNKSLKKPDRGSFVDTWDGPINDDWDYIDRALGGSYTIGVQAVPATPVSISTDDARYQQIKISNQTAIITVQIPLIIGSSTVAVGGMWIVDNNSNTFDVYLTTLAPGTNTLTLKAGKRYTVYSNGSGVFFADDSRLEASATSGLKIVGNAISIEGTNSVLTTARGGTGYSNGYTSGQLLIGKADGTLTRATLTAGTNVTITNGDGSITINSSGGSGTGGLTSIGLNTTLSGISFNPSTINTTNTSTTLQGTLGISSGGTGTNFGTPNVNPGIVKLSGVNLISVSTIDISTETSNTLPVARGGTGATAVVGTGSNVLATGPTISGPTFTGTTTTAAISTTGNITVTGNISATGSLTGGSLSVPSISTTGNISSSGGTVSGTALSTTGTITGASVSTTGNISSSAGTVSGASLSSSGTISGASLSTTGNISSSGGTVSGSNLSTSGSVTGGSFLFPSSSGAMNLSGSTYSVTIGGTNAFGCSTTNFSIPVNGTVGSNFTISQNLQVNGTPFCATQASFTVTSDARTKKDVQPYLKSLNDVITLDPVTFEYNGEYGTPTDNVKRVGLIAQQVNNTPMSELVGTYVYTDPNTGQQTTLYNLNVSDLMFAFINSIKALDARVKELEAKVGP